MKKKFAIAVALVLLLPIIALILWKSSEYLILLSEEIELTPLNAKSGEIFTFEVKSRTQGIITLPENVLFYNDGKFTKEKNLTFSNDYPFKVLISPYANSINITIKTKHREKTYEILVEKSPSPLLSGKNKYDNIKYLGSYIPHRVTSSAELIRAANWFYNEFTKLGLDAEIKEYVSDMYQDLSIYAPVGAFIENVIAYKWGENTKEWLVLGAHYDVVPTTWEGAYDNTAGSTAVLEIARGISKIKTNKTIVFGLWSGEEEGLWGAREFVESIPEDVKVLYYQNYDMSGINFPADYELHALIGPDKDAEVIEQGFLLNITNQTIFENIGYPPYGFNITEDPMGRSDHVRFQEAGISTVFFIGERESYSAYHTPDDTLEEMENVAGGKEILIQALDVVAWIGFYLTINLDLNII